MKSFTIKYFLFVCVSLGFLIFPGQTAQAQAGLLGETGFLGGNVQEFTCRSTHLIAETQSDDGENYRRELKNTACDNCTEITFYSADSSGGAAIVSWSGPVGRDQTEDGSAAYESALLPWNTQFIGMNRGFNALDAHADFIQYRYVFARSFPGLLEKLTVWQPSGRGIGSFGQLSNPNPFSNDTALEAEFEFASAAHNRGAVYAMNCQRKIPENREAYERLTYKVNVQIKGISIVRHREAVALRENEVDAEDMPDFASAGTPPAAGIGARTISFNFEFLERGFLFLTPAEQAQRLQAVASTLAISGGIYVTYLAMTRELATNAARGERLRFRNNAPRLRAGFNHNLYRQRLGVGIGASFLAFLGFNSAQSAEISIREQLLLRYGDPEGLRELANLPREHAHTLLSESPELAQVLRLLTNE